MSAKSGALLALCMLLGACTVGEDYEKPKLNLGDKWQAIACGNTERPILASAKGTNIVQMPFAVTRDWWERFKDPLLSQLLKKARANNYDLKVALGRIAEERGNVRVADAALYPQVNANASIARNGALRSTATPPDTNRQIGLSGSWDIDILGGDRRNIEAALAEVRATEADRDKVQLSIITDVATNYIQLRSLQQQRALTARNLTTQRDTLNVL